MGDLVFCETVGREQLARFGTTAFSAALTVRLQPLDQLRLDPAKAALTDAVPRHIGGAGKVPYVNFGALQERCGLFMTSGARCLLIVAVIISSLLLVTDYDGGETYNWAHERTRR